MGTASQFVFPDGSQMSVELCGIDAPELKQGKTPGQPLANEAKQKLTLANRNCPEPTDDRSSDNFQKYTRRRDICNSY